MFDVRRSICLLFNPGPAIEASGLIEQETSLEPDPDKPEITNSKQHMILKLGQINSKLQYPNPR
jgi:hypothetical protein